jgi:hypothetical protein
MMPRIEAKTTPFDCSVLGRTVFVTLFWLLHPIGPDIANQFECNGHPGCGIGLEWEKCPHPYQHKVLKREK